MSLTKLAEVLEGASIPPILVLTGDAPLLVDEGVRRTIAAITPRVGLAAFNHSTYRASEPGAVEALSTARTLPMMADLRLVVLLGIEEGSEELFAALVDYANDPSPTTNLVVAGAGFPKVRKGGKAWGTRLKNAVKKTGLSLSLDNKSIRPQTFAMKRASGHGKRLRNSEAALLVELVGSDLSRLAQEVDKLCLYVGEEADIRREDVSAACSLLAEAVIWNLTAGLAARDPEAALGALHRLLEDGDPPHRLLSMIMWQYRTILVAAEMASEGASDDAIRRATRMHWETFKRLKPSLKQGVFAPERVLARLARANREMNSRRAGDRRVLEALVVELVAA